MTALDTGTLLKGTGANVARLEPVYTATTALALGTLASNVLLPEEGAVH